MSTTLAVNTANDIYLTGGGDLAMTADLEATLQGCAQAAKSFVTEMQYQVDRGLPNFEVLWSGAPSAPQYEAALRRELLQVTDVLGVPNIIVTFAGGIAAYTATIKTTFGTGIING